MNKWILMVMRRRIVVKNKKTEREEKKMKQFSARLLFIATTFVFFGCEASYHGVPPNDIAMMLTPTGYEDKIYTPGQVDIGQVQANGSQNRLVLIQRSGIEVKEPFIGKEASEDKEDHRCLTGDKAPVTLDVRLLFALPDYERPEGKKDLARIFLLGNPKEVEGSAGRVLRISADSVYAEQAKQSVRGKIRQICSGYKDFDAIFSAFAKEGEGSLVIKIEGAVADVLREKNVPLRLVSGFPSNLKPDPSVTDAIAAQQVAEKRVEAIQTITDFLDKDSTGTRRLVYQMQVWQEIVAKGNANGHNTIFLSSVPQVGILPLSQK